MSSSNQMTPGAERPKREMDLKGMLQIRLPVIAVLGEKRMKLAEVLKLGVGSILQLHKPSEELLDLMVNNRRVAGGETVRTGDNFGLQIVEMGSVEDILRKLGTEPGD